MLWSLQRFGHLLGTTVTNILDRFYFLDIVFSLEQLNWSPGDGSISIEEGHWRTLAFLFIHFVFETSHSGEVDSLKKLCLIFQ